MNSVQNPGVAGVVRDVLADILAMPAARITGERVFAELGLDSGRAVQFAAELARRLDRPVPGWLVWQHPTVGDLAAALTGTATVVGSRCPATVSDQQEPIAIVGIGARLPGGIDGPQALWGCLRSGRDTVGEVPADRWDAAAWYDADPQAPGRMATRWGGFLDDISTFDAELFRISPAEAKQMDPQQRIALEVAWSALEDAGIAPTGLAGSRTGVFFGAMFQEYRSATGAGVQDIGTHSATGWDNSVIPARIAYVLGLRGPVLGVATACSSSLTAVHLAVRSLRAGESDVALAGGVNLIMDPQTTVAMTKFGAMSPTGQCRAFDAGANGYVRGEGCGVVVLRPLSAALAAGDRIYAVIRGSAVNNDGASNGLTAPSPQAQVEVLRAAWQDAGVDPVAVSYVEAHGTGTLLGDPIEAQALGTVFGGADRDGALQVGSAKTNFGHLEPAAGITGLVKTALALRHGELPASLHFAQPNPHIDFAACRLQVVDTHRRWPDGPRYAGVSSFGFGGSNAHVALEAAPQPVVVDPAPPREDRPALVFAFSGHGAQWLGMGRDLLAEPVFRAAVEECDRAGGFAVLDALATGAPLTATADVQPALFAVQAGLVRLLAHWGIRPDAVFGQSVGEVAAAVCAGALSLAEGARVIGTWSALIGEHADGQGTLLVAELDPADLPDGMEIAGYLAPGQLCLTGPADAVAAAQRTLTERGVWVAPVDIGYPAHSCALAGLAGELRRRLGTVDARPAEVPLWSTVTGGVVDGTGLGAEYWVRNMTAPMLVAETVTALAADAGALTVLEIGPHAVLRRPVERTLGADVQVLAGCLRSRPAADQLAEVLTTLRAAGHGVGATPADDEPVCLPVSGATEAALRRNAGRMADFLTESGAPLPVTARAAATGRAQLTHRAAVLATEPAGAAAGLRALACGEPGTGVLDGTARQEPLAVLFTGQGSQYPHMGRALYRRFDRFRAAFDEVTAALDEHTARPVAEVLFAPDDPALLDQTEFTQPALFAVEVALYRLWESFGVRADLVAGHSVGEIAAAHVAGMLDLADAARLVAARGRLMQSCPAGGAMVSVQADETEVLAALSEVDGQLSVAGLNTPDQTVLSGDADAVHAVAARFAARGRKVRRLSVSHAFHSPHMDPMLAKYAEVVPPMRPARIPLLSTVHGDWLDGAGPDYWVRQVREPVRFADAVRRLADAGAGQFLECGPAPVLSAMGLACLAEPVHGGFVASMRRDTDEVATLFAAAGALHVAGRQVDWPAVYGARGAGQLDLPGYAFDRTRYWLQPRGGAGRSAADGAFWQAVRDGSLAELLDVPGEARDAVTALLPYLDGWRGAQQDRATVDGLCYADTWRRDTAPAARLRGTWVLVEPDGVPAIADAVDAALTAAGATVRRMPADGTGPLPGDVAGVLSLAALDDTADPEHPGLPRGVLRTVRLVQELDGGPLWVLTRGAVATSGDDRAPAPEQALCWGLGQVAALEYGPRWGGLIDLPADLDEAAAGQLVATIAGDAGEEHVALRACGRFVRRLRRSAPPPVRPWRARGTVLITGGSGALAARLARWVADRGAEHVVLVSRSGACAAQLPGVRVTALPCDITDRAQVAVLLAGLDRDGDAPTAVFHTAGVLDDGMLADLTPASLATVTAPKLTGAQHLDELTADRDLDAFVLFSSVVGVLGNAGQAGYAMANAALDALAARRRAAGRPAVSVAWGPWADGGMAAGAVGEHLRRRGLLPMPADTALRGLDAALGARGSLLVADVRWPDAAPVYGGGGVTGRRALLRDIPDAELPAAAPTAEPLSTALAGLARDARLDRVQALLATEAAAVLDVPDPAVLDVRRGFADLGFDSMMAHEFSQRVQRRTGVSTPRTLTFDHPCLADAARWLLGELVPESAAVTAGVGGAQRSGEALAIVGAGLRMPGGAHDLDGFWEVLANGRDTVTEIPQARFDIASVYDPDRSAMGTSYVRHASLLDDVASFDAAFFGISPREAASMDPQHRLLLEATWNALEAAGIRPDRLRESCTGVFVGAGSGEYGRHLGVRDQDTYTLTGSLASFNAGRLAYHLGAQGPALAVDTACSSSLVALHLACEALRAGECDLALAGGVQVLADPGMFVALSRSQALSADGRSRTFSAGADGYGRGEGVAMVAVMRLSDALAQHRPVLGVVRGTAINHDGASSGITAPNGTAQQKVIRGALRSGGLAAADVDYVECHGTGTELGDPIEVQALAAVYGQDRDPGAAVAIGTAKSVIGHLESAAGIAGVCKVLASLRHQALPATLNSTPRNPNIAWDTLPVRVVDDLTPWPRRPDAPRRAGVSSFGLSGTNAHVIIEEFTALP